MLQGWQIVKMSKIACISLQIFSSSYTNTELSRESMPKVRMFDRNIPAHLTFDYRIQYDP
jgi:hypothetical protein